MKLSGRILVDMDSTLYYAPFSEACRVIWGADSPPTREVDTWLWWEQYGISTKQWRTAVNFVHDHQHVYPAMPLAREALQRASKYFQITVTSQRSERYKKSIDWWLAENDIPAYDTRITPTSKVDLWREGDIVIDDAPKNILSALKRGAHVITLSYPYNRYTKALGATHVTDWSGIGIFLEGMIKNAK